MFLNPFKNIAFSDNWFKQFNYLFTFLLNNKKTGEYLRSKLHLNEYDVNVPITKITRNSVHYGVDKSTIQAVIYSYDRISNLMKLEFENIFMYIHKFDINIANKFVPILNLGYDTLTSYSTTADGYATRNHSTWTTVRNSITSTVNSTATSSTTAITAYLSNSVYYIHRSLFYFDTSSLVSATILSVVFSLYGSTTNGSDVCVMKGTQATPFVSASFASFEGNSYGVNNTWATSGYNDITFDAQGISDIVQGGTTKLMARNYTHDYLNSAPTTTGTRCGCHYSDYSGTARDPKLVITYTISSTTKYHIY